MLSIKELMDILDDLETNKEVKNKPSDAPNEAIGYTTIIPDDVFSKAKDLLEAHAELARTLSSHVDEVTAKLKSLPQEEKDYAMLQYSMFSDMLKDSYKASFDLVSVHKLSTKDSIDETMKEEGLSISQFLRMKMFQDLVDILI